MPSNATVDPVYEGREHSRIKHLLLEAYLTRLVMIVGQKFDNIAYIDGFAGPWRSSAEDYADSSFGIALRVLENCQKTLNQRLNPRFKTRALFIEQDSKEAAKIRKYCLSSEVWEGDFSKLVGNIPKWLKTNEFAFVFVDPFGWKDVITPAILAPLLQRKNTELLINVMWDHIRLATGHDNQIKNLEQMFGPGALENLPNDAAPKRHALMMRYRKQLEISAKLSTIPRLRTQMIPIEYVDKNSVKFYLVYVTHKAIGIITFGEESEKIQRTQKELKFIHRLNKLENRTGIQDLFGLTSTPDFTNPPQFADALEVWRAKLDASGGEITVDDDVFAEMAEESDLLPHELQDGVGRLVAEGEVKIPSAKKNRPKNPINWRQKEKLVRII